MAQVRSWAGLDVHASKVVAATVDGQTAEVGARRLSGNTDEVVGFCAALPAPTRVAYEAGPTGFALARALEAAGIGCVVAAPGKIERPAQDRIKTDRRGTPLASHLHGVRVTKLMRGEASSHAGLSRQARKLRAHRGRRAGGARRRAMHHNKTTG